MKIGFVVEGSNEDAGDVHVVRVLCERIAAEKGVQRSCVVFAGGSKPEVIRNSAKHVALLRVMGCQRIILIWDNCPPWSGNLASEAFASGIRVWRTIKKGSIHTNGIALVCAKRELEAWLLTDDAAVRTVLGAIGRGSMPGISGANKPDTVSAPKDRLHRWWYERCRRVPSADEYAQLARHARLSKLRKSPSFVRFEQCI